MSICAASAVTQPRPRLTFTPPCKRTAYAAACDVDFQRCGFGFDALEPDRDVVGAARVTHDGRLVVAHVDFSALDLELTQYGVHVALQHRSALGDVDVEMIGTHVERLPCDDSQRIGMRALHAAEHERRQRDSDDERPAPEGAR
jgi:hypothetical protein